jgi:hypothetical protein
MTDRQSERRTWLLKMRAEWFRLMRPLGEWVPWELRELVELSAEPGEPAFWGEGIVTEAPQLGEEHVRNCLVLPTRTHILRRFPKGGIVAELGVLHGEFSRQIVEIVSPTELHLIDHHLELRARALASDPGGRIRLHEGDSAETLEAFPDEYFDWIYIDAQHTYEGVRRDIAVGRRKVKKTGLLVFNDYTPWSYVEMQPYGVVAAVNELCIDDGWEIVYLSLPAHMYCDVAIRKVPLNRTSVQD